MATTENVESSHSPQKPSESTGRWQTQTDRRGGKFTNTNRDSNASEINFRGKTNEQASKYGTNQPPKKTSTHTNHTNHSSGRSTKLKTATTWRKERNDRKKIPKGTQIKNEQLQVQSTQLLQHEIADEDVTSTMNSQNSVLKEYQKQIKEATVEEIALDYTNPNHAVDGSLLKCLRDLIHSEQELRKAGYVVEQLSSEQLESKRRCQDCNKMIGVNPYLVECDAIAEVLDMMALRKRAEVNSAQEESTFPKVSSLKCRFHSGRLVNKVWTCCQIPSNNNIKFCKGRIGHEPKYYRPGQLESLWQYQQTPSKSSKDARAAVAIDCEMGVSVSGDSELIRVSLVDFFTSEILVDKLVYPTVPMLHLNTRYSGVSRQQMETARRLGNCLTGKTKALDAVWKYVDERTVVVGHSAQNDLTSLRWIHGLIVDSYLIEQAILKKEKEEQEQREAEEKKRMLEEASMDQSFNDSYQSSEQDGYQAVENEIQEEKKKIPRQKGSGPLALKVLTKKRVGMDIQMGNEGHDSVEDALAARDIVKWHVIKRMEKVIAEASETPVDQLIDLSLE